VFSYDDAEIKRLARHTRKAVVVQGYSSMIYNIAKALNADASLPRPGRLKLVKGTSEKIFEAYQEEARKAFGMRIVSEYGAAETGLIAFECPHGSMHVHMEGCHVEVLDGEAVVTNLLSRSFPIIRYRLGDKIELAPEDFECACGMKHTVIREVLGRVGKVVHGRTRQFPSLVFYYVFKNIFFEKGIALSYQVRQHEKGKVIVDIEQYCADVLPLVLAEIAKYFGDDLEADVRFGQKVDLGSKKRRDFVSYLN
jgi:phenylacetate-CoA ligase